MSIYTEERNALIDTAAARADKETKWAHISKAKRTERSYWWNQLYFAEMNRLAVEKGLTT